MKTIFTFFLVLILAPIGLCADGPKLFNPPSLAKPVSVVSEKCCGEKCKCEFGKCKCVITGDCLKLAVSTRILTYAEGCELSKQKGLPLITFVGPSAESVKPFDGYVVCQINALDDYVSGDKVYSKWVGEHHILVSVENPNTKLIPTVIPAGHHSHTTIDGRTIIHGNENLGSFPAHAGIVYPWIRTGEAGQTTFCPNGRCPNR